MFSFKNVNFVIICKKMFSNTPLLFEKNKCEPLKELLIPCILGPRYLHQLQISRNLCHGNLVNTKQK
jgi:hypothetical protein